MAQIQSNLNHSSSSSRYGGASASAVASAPSTLANARRADVLASCYVIDNTATQLKGLHYCTTPLAGAECPPLAAITANNELAVFPKKTRPSSSAGSAANNRGRGGATLRIREECERLFCETMKTVFLGERNMVSNGSGLTGVLGVARHDAVSDNYSDYDDDGTPPADDHLRRVPSATASYGSRGSFSSAGASSLGARSDSTAASSVYNAYAVPSAWLELWDFAGGASFRGFMAEDPTGGGQQTLFAFFDAHVLNRDLKRALMALIELADTALGCAHLVICVDRGHAEALPDETATLLKGLQWAGFSLTTLDAWTGNACVDVTSSKWIFMGMEM